MSKDLIVLVADLDQEITIQALLTQRQESLKIRSIDFEIRRDTSGDGNVYRWGYNILSLYIPPTYSHGMIVLDREWEGSPGNSAKIRKVIRTQLLKSGWRDDNCEVIVPDPEIEAWVWSQSPHVAKVLRTPWEEIHLLAEKNNFWSRSNNKPTRPKELLRLILRKQHRPPSSDVFKELAQVVGLNACQDPEFVLFRETLQRWFPQPTVPEP